MKLKIALILTEFPPKFGGMQTHAQAMCSLLAKEYQLVVFTYRATTLVQEAEEFDNTVDYPVRRILSRLSFFSNIRILEKELSVLQPVLIYSSTIFYGYLKKHFDVPIICRSVGNDMLRPWIIYPFKFGSSLLNRPWMERLFHWAKSSISQPPTLNTIFSKKRKRLSVECAQGAHAILANSAYTKSIFDQKNILQCKVLAGGVDVEKYSRPDDFDTITWRKELGIKPDTFVIITACRFVKKKGIDFLIESFQRLELNYSNLELLIIGEGPLGQKLRRQATSPNIHFIGKKSQEDIPKYFWAADLFVLCSREVTNPNSGYKDVETMGRVLCEANAAALPVLASDTGGVSSIIEHQHNGLLYKTDNFDSFQTHFHQIHQNPAEANKLVLNGIQKATHQFDWSIVLKEHQKIFRLITEEAAVNGKQRSSISLQM